MGNAVRRQGEGLCGGREVPPPRVARTGLGAGLWRAGRAPEGADPEPEGAGQGRAGERRRGRANGAERAPEGADLGRAGPGVRPALAEVVEEGGGESARSGG